MISDEKKKTITYRPITGKFSYCYTAQHGIVSLSLILILVLLPSAGAQPPNPSSADTIPITRFTPSMAIIVAVLVAALFFMGFFSIYIRQCSENSSIGSVRQLGASMRARRAAAAAARGLDATVIESFPTFLYSAVKGLKIGKGALECAVCLNEFEDDETLRLIPKCDHVFHPECIDEWLTSHVTCPVCRSNLVPQSGETVEVPDLNAEPEHDPEPDNLQNAAVSIRMGDDHVVDVQEEPPKPVVDRNQSFNRFRAARSWSVKSSLFGKFPRSHSTGHSLVQPGENTERFTLRLPADVRKQVMNRALNRTTSCLVVLPREGSSRRGNRTGGGEGRFNRRLEKLDRGVKSDRWVFTMFTRASSSLSPKVVDANGEGTSSTSTSTTPKGLKTAVRLPSFKCLEPKGDETGLLPADSARVPV